MESAIGNYLHAINPDGTFRWSYSTGDIYSSPSIGEDNTIYFASSHGYPWYGYINALYSNNGTLKWRYQTNHVIYSAPAIGDDGTIYCGSHDNHLYALYPNGTLKWKYGTGNWIRVSPCIADDGTIYVVSLDNYLYAVYPNGTLKWKTYLGEAGTSPTIGQNGTIYCGYNDLYAINPIDGSVKWIFDPGYDRRLRGGTPCNSIDGTIYLGTHIWDPGTGEIIAVTPDGSEKWRFGMGQPVESAPAIGEDGTVYFGCSMYDDGYLRALGDFDPNAPSAPDIDGPPNGKIRTEYDYTFKSTSPLGNDIYYYINWGDGDVEEWIGPYESGEEVIKSHSWSSQGTYTIKARGRDIDNLLGPWGSLEVSMPRNKATSNVLFLRFLEQSSPSFLQILQRLMNIR